MTQQEAEYLADLTQEPGWPVLKEYLARQVREELSRLEQEDRSEHILQKLGSYRGVHKVFRFIDGLEESVDAEITERGDFNGEE